MNADPRLWLFFFNGLHTFSCLESLFMVIKHFLKVFNWNHVMEVRGRFLYPIFFLGCWYGYLVICESLIFGHLTFCWNVELIWMWDILLLNCHPFGFFSWIERGRLWPFVSFYDKKGERHCSYYFGDYPHVDNYFGYWIFWDTCWYVILSHLDLNIQ